MSRSTARCAKCHANLLHHQKDGQLVVLVAGAKVDPTRHEGVVLIIRCGCGTVREWVVRERDACPEPLRPTG